MRDISEDEQREVFAYIIATECSLSITSDENYILSFDEGETNKAREKFDLKVIEGAILELRNQMKTIAQAIIESERYGQISPQTGTELEKLAK